MMSADGWQKESRPPGIPDPQVQCFAAHFSWVPMPAHVVEYVLLQSGHVSNVATVQLVTCVAAVRERLRSVCRCGQKRQPGYHALGRATPERLVQEIKKDRFVW